VVSFLLVPTPKNLYAFLLTSVHATCPTNLILLDLIILIIFGKDYNYETPHYVVFSNPFVFHHDAGPKFLINTSSIKLCITGIGSLKVEIFCCTWMEFIKENIIL
jgi:hypothetical protein